MKFACTFRALAQVALGAGAATVAVVVAPAQLVPPTLDPITGARLPALSPDGKRLAFVYRGDLWLASAKGGRATPLTQHIETDTSPVFSPDGQWIAFASRRSGSLDIFAVPAEGGPARQLTWHAGTDVPQGWSPDSKQILFTGRRDGANFGIFALDVASLRTELLCEDYAPLSSPSFSPSGRLIAYSRYGFHWTRPRYAGSAAAQIWLLDRYNGDRRPLTTNGHQHLWPRFLPDGQHLVTVTVGESTPSSSPLDATIPKITDNPRRTPNLWLLSLQGERKQLTTFTGGAVRWPAVAARSGDLACEYDGDLYLLPKGRPKPQKLKLLVAADDKQTTRRREKLTRDVTEAEPSPDGKTLAFGLRGDIWTVPVERPKGIAGRNADIARRLTDWVGADEDFSWSRDGKRLYFISNRERNFRLYELELATLKTKCLWDRPEEVIGPRVSPDGKQLGFWVSGREGGLHLMDLSNNVVRRLVKAPGPQWRGHGGGEFEWSPDMQWIAYSRRGDSGAWNIWIIAAAGGDAVNVTRLHAQHNLPAWSPDGKYLFFRSNREGDGLYVLPLRQELVRIADTDVRFERPTNTVEVQIEFDDLSRRIRKLAHQAPQSDLTVTPDGQIVFLCENDIWAVGYDGKDLRRLTTGGGKSALRLSREGRRAFFMQNGELFTMPLDSKMAEKVTFMAEWERDLRAERQAAFDQFWHSYSRGFYDANFHGRDWEAIRRRYEPLLDAQETAEDFAGLLHMMVGELECSHAEVTPATTSGTPAPVTPHLGFSLDYTHPGPGLRVREVPEGAPGWYHKTRLHPGEYVLAINGRDVGLDERLYEFINDRQDREFEFLVSTNTEKAGARTVRYKVLTQEEWTELNYRARVERSRRRVAERSGDQIGYLHMPGMMQKDQAQFEREAYEYITDKEALILDVRFNSGGNIADTLIDWLERKPYGYIRPRDGQRQPSPYRAWEKPIVVLINEHSYSNGEIFACALRARGLAKLVGTPTPGYVIWTYNFRLSDGTNARMPESGFYRLDGTPIENHGEQPDVLVPLTPDDWLARRDPQLDKAIELLTGRLDAAPMRVE
jgi:Tol biopolymer transport system component/C-terminal processing protease CtpA/Prc